MGVYMSEKIKKLEYSFEEAIQYIANNEKPNETDISLIKTYTSVSLLSKFYSANILRISKKIKEHREKSKN